MKRLFTFVITMLLGASLAFAQAGGGSTGTPAQDTSKSDTGKKGKKSHKAHKGGKKSKKGAGDAGTTPPPK